MSRQIRKEMIFHTQEFNSLEGENNLFIMDVPQDSNGNCIYSMPLRFRTNSKNDENFKYNDLVGK